MAQPIHCDFVGQESHLADVMTTRIADGDTTAWCFQHYVEVCQAVIEAALASDDEAAQVVADAAARLDGSHPGPGEAIDQDTDQAAPTAPAEPAGPDGGPGGEAGDQPDQAGLGGQAAGNAEEPTAATADR